ncbi:hypothetical protein WJX72_004290 [[Myrmecia] bisecta]|uniref:Alanine-glyoxylate aminotransferase n=1 Tax=[Myrmecia] bisecta TaxID=41462 RepID=A0AAW1QQ59_9CHLO
MVGQQGSHYQPKVPSDTDTDSRDSPTILQLPASALCHQDGTLTASASVSDIKKQSKRKADYPDSQALLQKRRQVLGPNTAINYSDPVQMVRGEGAHLYDAEGNEYLDCVNNVAHVGHCHPKVASAVSQQMFTLNTNVRYLHQNVVKHAVALVATMPQPLEVVYMVCSGSEANDLALRIARSSTSAEATHVAVMDGAYHGHTQTLIDMSPYKFNGPGGAGRKPHVHVLPCPDVYRGLHLDGRAAARQAIDEAHAAGAKICAFFCESVLSCGGQVVLPEGYLQAVYEEMHAEGAVCVADEVQCGFGRVGSHFWGFETQHVVPDIVTLGKPIGNGFPMGAVVLQRRLAANFDNGMEYFNTCGGCTAAGAAGLAVLEVLREERLQQNALTVGRHLEAEFRQLQQEFPDIIGHVRGLGFMLGLEIIASRESQLHAPVTARWIKDTMRQRRVLLSCDGLRANIVKFKPPMCFSRQDADRLVHELTQVLRGGIPADVRAVDQAPAPAAICAPVSHVATAPPPALAVKTAA